MADDADAVITHAGVCRAVVGGVSMGAGIALNFGLRHPDKTAALVLSRPAWLNESVPGNLAVYPKIAALVEQLGRHRARDEFEQSNDYRELASGFPAAAASLLVCLRIGPSKPSSPAFATFRSPCHSL